MAWHKHPNHPSCDKKTLNCGLKNYTLISFNTGYNAPKTSSWSATWAPRPMWWMPTRSPKSIFCCINRFMSSPAVAASRSGDKADGMSCNRDHHTGKCTGSYLGQNPGFTSGRTYCPRTIQARWGPRGTSRCCKGVAVEGHHPPPHGTTWSLWRSSLRWTCQSSPERLDLELQRSGFSRWSWCWTLSASEGIRTEPN